MAFRKLYLYSPGLAPLSFPSIKYNRLVPVKGTCLQVVSFAFSCEAHKMHLPLAGAIASLLLLLASPAKASSAACVGQTANLTHSTGLSDSTKDVYVITGKSKCGVQCPHLREDKEIHIVGASAVAEDNVLYDLQCSYSTIGTFGSLHFKDVTLFTDNVDAYAVHTKNTLVWMDNVVIEGYSGCRAGQSWANNTCVEKAGGAMRIRDANYTGVAPSASKPTMRNVRVYNACRGFRLQDNTRAYVKDCATFDVTDNAFYMAASTYDSSTGCVDTTFHGCKATRSGNNGFISIGGYGNLFKDIEVHRTRGAGFIQYNQNNAKPITLDGGVFTQANVAATITPWNGATDEPNGATIAMSVADEDTQARLVVRNVVFRSTDGVTPPPNAHVFHNNGVGKIEIHCSFDYDPDAYPSGLTKINVPKHGFPIAEDTQNIYYKCYRPLNDILKSIPRTPGSTVFLNGGQRFTIAMDMTQTCGGDSRIPAYLAQLGLASDTPDAVVHAAIVAMLNQTYNKPWHHSGGVGTVLAHVTLPYVDPQDYAITILDPLTQDSSAMGPYTLYFAGQTNNTDFATPIDYRVDYYTPSDRHTPYSTIQTGGLTYPNGAACTRCHFTVSGEGGQRGAGYPLVASQRCAAFAQRQLCSGLKAEFRSQACC